ncbi:MULTISPECIES: hypothetical protein [unclassified Bradyrhizobium]|uniref:hypothetical protein n=1 Tax=unclassified Bradyrhizobium TaxID=2631580 RepID=UPI00247A470F|nr:MULTISPECIES: hypothetical protein [unclassified Bradyrhizobium]WGS20541.1 hypothetical protein MTX22_01495 [Bradyrhizobium sp. ISRA463]WGS27426.1 hypothetical protein MTX19_38380 [Bradyrhizobium sp. ISRA464]
MKYICPILFPLDLIVMLALAGSMGAASAHWIKQLDPSVEWLGLLLPAVYLLSDLIEDACWRGCCCAAIRTGRSGRSRC